MADRRKLMAGILNLPESARKDLAQRAQDVEREGVVGMLRKATGEMYNNPIVNTAIGFTPGVGDVQAAGETFAALQRGAPWQETAGYAVGMLPFVPALRTTWHGSPHGFTKFDMSKIGTGEGAQAYGHGLYLAEARPVAEEYARMNITGPSNVAHVAAKGPISPLDTLKMVYPNKPDEFYEAAIKGAEEPGYLYKVDLPDEQIAKMLDWDKPLSEQAPEVINAMKNMTNDVISGGFDLSRSNRDLTRAFNPVTRDEVIKEIMAEYPHLSLQNGKLYERSGSEIPEMAITDWMRNKHGIGYEDAGQWIRDMSHVIGSQADVSSTLFNNGIPGIKYLDQASRGAGEGTRNYVVFSDEIPQILERNGQPIAQALRDYRGSHTAPGPEFGAQLHDVTGGGQMYPEDIYSAQGARLYGHGGPDVGMDKETMRIIQQMRNKPDEMVDIYRAVPNEADISTINPGDWVTINPNYAKQHGESNLPEGYKILQQKVPAKSVWTNADSIHEYGYWPE